jgi:molybdopterin molybdotransferase
MITFEEAIKRIDMQNVMLTVVVVNTNFAIGQVSKDNIYNIKKIPVIRNSAVDGYAVRYSTVRAIGYGNVIFLRVVSCQDVDIYKDVFIAVEVMTGAKVPYGFDAVLKVEDVLIYDNKYTKYIYVHIGVVKNINVKVVGEDFGGGEIILRKNGVVSVSHVVVLCLFGFFFLRIFKLPRVAIFSTGDEISNCKDVMHPSSDSYITPVQCSSSGYNTSIPYILNFFKALGIIVDYYGCYQDTVKDIYNAFKYIESRRQFYNLIITTGAVSKGKKDFVKSVFSSVGGEVIFHGVCVKPGKPILFGFNRSKKYYFFGLPGNVFASITSVCFLVFYFIKNKLGIPTDYYINTRSLDNIHVKRSFTYFLKTDIFYYRGALYSSVQYGQESFKLSSLLDTKTLTLYNSSLACGVHTTCPLYFNLY